MKVNTQYAYIRHVLLIFDKQKKSPDLINFG